MLTHRNRLSFWRRLPACGRLAGLLAALCLFNNIVWAQSPLPLRVGPLTPVACKPATSFSTIVRLYNTASDTLHLTMEMAANAYFKGLQGSKTNITIAPSDSIALSLRFVNTWGRINGSYELGIWLRSAGGQQTQISIPVVLEGGIQPGVYAEVMQEKMLVLPGSAVVNLPVHIRSMLPENTPLFIEQLPGTQSLKLAGSPLAVRLPSVRDTTLSLSFFRERNTAPGNPTPVVLQVRDAAGKVWTTFNFLPQLLASSRSFYQPGPAPAGITLAANFSSLGRGSYQHEYRWALSPLTNQGPFSAQVSYQEEQPFGTRRMQNTWVQYRRNNLHWIAGSQNGFHELNLQGRGFAATQSFRDDKIQASAWLIDQNPNLLAPLGKGYQVERIASGQIRMQGKADGHTLVNGSWFQRRQNQSMGQLVFAEWQPASKSKQVLLLRLGMSREHFELSDTSLNGWSGRLEWKHTGKKTQWFALGQLATPTYAGQMRGQSQFTFQTTHNLAQGQALLVRLSAYQLQTDRNLVKIYGSNQFIATQSAEVDYSVRKGSWTGNWRAYLLQQKQMLPLMLGQSQLASLSPRTAAGLNGKAGPIFFSTLWDAGWQQAAMNGNKQKGTLAWKSNTQLTWKTLSVQATVQQGAYYVAELLDQVYTGRPFGSLIFNGAYACNLGKSGSLQASLFTTKNNVQQGWFSSAIIQGRWQVKQKWQGTAMLLYQESTGLQANIGVQQTFALRQRPANSTHFSLQVFEDKNGNGTREADEQFASGQIVQVDDVLLITDKQGFLKIKHISKGRHQIRILSKGSAAKAMVARSVHVTGKDVLVLGIPPIFTIQGKVVANKDRYTGVAESVGGVKVVIAGADGEQFAFTREDGFFTFEAPAGEYRVYLSQQQAVAATTIFVHPQQGFTGKLELVWTAGERPVQVKKVKIQ